MQGRLLPKYKNRYQAFPKNCWKNEFMIAKQFELDLIEFIFDYEDYNQNPLMSNSGITEIKKITNQSKVNVKTICADYFMKAPLHSEKKNIRDKSIFVLKKLLNLVKNLNVTDIIIPCVDGSSLKNKNHISIFKNSINEVLDFAEKYNINLSLETDLGPQEFAELLSLIDSKNITVNYDIGNSTSLGYEYKEEFQCYGKKITDIHIKDRKLKGGSVFLGNGDANFDGILEDLKKNNYQGPFVMQAYRDDEGVEIFKKQFSWFIEKLDLYFD